MSLRPYKFVVHAVLQKTNDGNVVGEAQTEPVVLFGCDALAQWARDFPEFLADVELKERDATEG